MSSSLLPIAIRRLKGPKPMEAAMEFCCSWPRTVVSLEATLAELVGNKLATQSEMDKLDNKLQELLERKTAINLLIKELGKPHENARDKIKGKARPRRRA